MGLAIDFYGAKTLKTVQADDGVIKYALVVGTTYRLDVTLRSTKLTKTKTATGRPLFRQSMTMVKTVFATETLARYERKWAFQVDVEEGDDITSVATEMNAIGALISDHDGFALDLVSGIFSL